MEKIEKLLNSPIREDIILGLILLYQKYGEDVLKTWLKSRKYGRTYGARTHFNDSLSKWLKLPSGNFIFLGPAYLEYVDTSGDRYIATDSIDLI